MKLLKIIEILKDVNNWHKYSSEGIIHKPTEICCHSGYKFWKNDEIIYEPNIWASILTTHYAESVKKYIKNKNQKNNLDKIYEEWKINFGNQSY